jgi:hypothetical protein
LRPIVVAAVSVDSWGVIQLAIRCHRCVPVLAGELEGWLERLVDDLRAGAGHATLRLSRRPRRMDERKSGIIVRDALDTVLGLLEQARGRLV